jgi:hypothetical protein
LQVWYLPPILIIHGIFMLSSIVYQSHHTRFVAQSLFGGYVWDKPIRNWWSRRIYQQTINPSDSRSKEIRMWRSKLIIQISRGECTQKNWAHANQKPSIKLLKLNTSTQEETNITTPDTSKLWELQAIQEYKELAIL